jgi:hypothetical protein
MAVKVTPTFVIEDLDAIELYGNLTLTGNYPAGGDTVDFTGSVGYQSPNGRIFAPAGPPIAGSGSVVGSCGDSFALVAGNALNNSKLIINTASNTPEGTGAYGAELLADANINFSIIFPKG